MPDPLLDDLRGIVGSTHVLTGDTTAGYCRDWTGRWSGRTRGVVRPGSVEEVSAVVRACGRAGVAIVPQGGNTGLVAGSIPLDGEVVVSTARLDGIGPVDEVSGQLTAGAGATIAAVQAAAGAAGWRYAVDFAARDTATIGGSVATNAGGHHVVRYGMTKRQLVGIEAVLADGRVVSHLGGLVKDNTGYDLAALFCGSEGTLGIVTSARLALVPQAGDAAVALVGFDTLDAAIAAVGPLRRNLPDLEAVELMTADGIAAVGSHLGIASPIVESPAVLLVEVVSAHDPVEQLAAGVESLDGVTDTAVAVDGALAESLWRWREAHTEMINQVGLHPPHKFDVTLPLAAIAHFVVEVRADVAAAHPGASVWIFGHAGDGNLHVNITGPEPDDERIDELVLRAVAAHGGSISAEHGIGRAKAPWLHLCRSQVEIDLFRAIKSALDPHGLLNPGVLLPRVEDQGLS